MQCRIRWQEQKHFYSSAFTIWTKFTLRKIRPPHMCTTCLFLLQLSLGKKEEEEDRSHQWSTRPAHSPGRQWLSLDFEVLGWTYRRTDERTLCVKIVITTGRDCGRPRGSRGSKSGGKNCSSTATPTTTLLLLLLFYYPTNFLIHEADPQARPVVINVFAHVVRSHVSLSIPLFKTKQNSSENNVRCILARLWVCPSGSLMTPVL